MPTAIRSDEGGRGVYKPFSVASFSMASNRESRTMMESNVFSARIAQPYFSTRGVEPILTRGAEPPSEPPSDKKPWNDIGSSRVRASEAIQRILGRVYHLRDPAEILRFLSRDSFLVPCLLRMYPTLRRHFGTRRIYLEVVAEPEFEDERLGVFVAVGCSADEALDLLGRFDEEWWSDIPSWLEKNLIVSVEFE